jgi:tetratricopeptide (TPR) repeat protein
LKFIRLVTILLFICTAFGVAEAQSGDVQELTSRIAQNPNDVEAYRSRANLYIRFQEKALAIADLTTALRLLSSTPNRVEYSQNGSFSPRTPRESTLSLRMRLSFEMKEYSLTEKDGTEYIKLLDARKSDAAKDANFQKLPESDRKGILSALDARLSEAYEYRGLGNRELGKPDLAIKDFRKAADLANLPGPKAKFAKYISDLQAAKPAKP